ncbi:MAG: MBL fold metallo-hydrolase [Promethearchaeota archaeon]
MSIFNIEQYVCKVCGFNMIGYHPNRCPFCGALSNNFITAEECSQNYEIVSNKVKNKVKRLNSYPNLGLEHAAYSIEIDGKRIWIDCPSTFNADLERMDKILFTHHHFLGASNLYREYYTAFIWIHIRDSEFDIAKKHPFDKKFENNFNIDGIKAFHIDGHTPGFTFYIFEDILFVCDYLIPKKGNFIFNPYGPSKNTIEGAIKLKKIIEPRNISIVCGYNYVLDYPYWKEKFDQLSLKMCKKIKYLC